MVEEDRIYEALQQLTQETQQKWVAMAEMQRDLQAARAEVAALAKILRDGNGRPAVLERVALLEASVTTLLGAQRDAEVERAQRVRDEGKGKWALTAAVATGVFSLIASLVGIAARFVHPF